MWCAYYYNLSTMPEDERPPDSVIDNDLLLENWLKKKEQEKFMADQKRRSKEAGEKIGRR